MELLIFLIIIILMIISNLYIRITYNKYFKIESTSKLSGFEVARKILDENGLDDIHIVETEGHLSDHYDPRRKVIRLSHDVFDGDSISSIAVAAHECGHAIQDKEGYAFLKFRSLIFPVVSFADRFTYILLFIGIITEITNLIYLGIGLMLFGLLFQVVTLPVEFNASSKAKKELLRLGLLNNKEKQGVNSVLTSAAFTYVAGALITLLNILRMFLASRDN